MDSKGFANSMNVLMFAGPLKHLKSIRKSMVSIASIRRHMRRFDGSFEMMAEVVQPIQPIHHRFALDLLISEYLEQHFKQGGCARKVTEYSEGGCEIILPLIWPTTSSPS
ncbi:hypothetical protein R1flu_001253 [Riccia fluitans]|uniref:Uncharacterized protein n=1 Tax=Riccia fluitans TaxID=41844 RepID=A0ABD1Y2Y9_9MARC